MSTLKMVFNRMKSFISYWYLQYLLATSVYMLEPLERRIFNCFLIVVLAMFLYTSYVFLPGHARMFMYFVDAYILGGNQPDVTVKGT
ncbi:serine palmitoyltransferase small subunit A-like [Ostrea edulis]|uniref:serine palmitoyltransferase small subunit A-like n=1 Tax=Ostrea edulis TaxID=37623 RepID=UPI0024AED5A2|nr:serine palmitoyltransferase small subunit A-like [Ostrea edulis]